MLASTLSAIGGISAFGAFLLRQRVSRNWISKSSICYQQFTKEQTVVVTGGNTGIGFEAAKDIASCGGKVILACRDGNTGDHAALQIRESTGNMDVECLQLDLASLDSVKAFASNLKTRNEKIHALICNAGVWVPDGGHKTRDGFEIHFGVNHLAHFALIQLLIPQMENSGMDSRIIIVSSGLAKSGQIDLQKRDFVYEARAPKPGEKASHAPNAYCDSKLMNMLTSRELAVKLQGSNITAFAVSPGFCQSKLGRNVHMPIHKKILVLPLMRLFQRSPAQGAQNIMFALMEDKSKLENGGMYHTFII